MKKLPRSPDLIMYPHNISSTLYQSYALACLLPLETRSIALAETPIRKALAPALVRASPQRLEWDSLISIADLSI
jgi:hypothetical protein